MKNITCLLLAVLFLAQAQTNQLPASPSKPERREDQQIIEPEADPRWKFIEWESTHLNPYWIEQQLKDNFGIVPLDELFLSLLDIVPERVTNKLFGYLRELGLDPR